MSEAPAPRPPNARAAGLAAFLKRHPSVLAIGSFVLLMTVWELAGRGGNPLLTSHPSAVYAALVKQLSSGVLVNATAAHRLWAGGAARRADRVAARPLLGDRKEFWLLFRRP
jgi:hypothetical protein